MGSSTPAAWLYRIARNKSLDELRRSKARGLDAEVPLDLISPLSDVGVVPTTDVEGQVAKASLRRELREALDRCRQSSAAALELAYFDGLTQRQIAEFTCTPVGTVKTRIRLGLEKLAHRLRAARYELADVLS